MKITDKVQISVTGVGHSTPKVWNWISLFLIGYATYQPLLLDWVHSAPFGSIEGKDFVMAWFDWLCPALGVVIQFTHKTNPENNGDTDNNTEPARWE